MLAGHAGAALASIRPRAWSPPRPVRMVLAHPAGAITNATPHDGAIHTYYVPGAGFLFGSDICSARLRRPINDAKCRAWLAERGLDQA